MEGRERSGVHLPRKRARIRVQVQMKASFLPARAGYMRATAARLSPLPRRHLCYVSHLKRKDGRAPRRLQPTTLGLRSGGRETHPREIASHLYLRRRLARRIVLIGSLPPMNRIRASARSHPRALSSPSLTLPPGPSSSPKPRLPPSFPPFPPGLPQP